MQTYTAQQIIDDALENLGIYAPGEVRTAADYFRMFNVLNGMMDEWAALNLFVTQLTAQTLSLVANTAQYTIGEASASVVTPRPPTILQGQGSASVLMTGASAALPVNVVSSIEFTALSAYKPPAGTPDTLFYNAAYPNGLLNVLPAPNATGTLTFYTESRLSSFSALTQIYTFSVGQYDMLRLNLAVRGQPYFATGQLNPIITQLAASARDFGRYQNMTSRAMFDRFTLSTNPQKPE